MSLTTSSEKYWTVGCLVGHSTDSERMGKRYQNKPNCIQRRQVTDPTGDAFHLFVWVNFEANRFKIITKSISFLTYWLLGLLELLITEYYFSHIPVKFIIKATSLNICPRNYTTEVVHSSRNWSSQPTWCSSDSAEPATQWTRGTQSAAQLSLLLNDKNNTWKNKKECNRFGWDDFEETKPESDPVITRIGRPLSAHRRLPIIRWPETGATT